ncbi:hypothetical protein BC834DRAFT_832867 [Gloeopeniophorella convolvens]|nr:hypothetical protein BC834DRAFT_832867 [Gloeopeniophorella convolvens]
MVFDKVMMRWVKVPVAATQRLAETGAGGFMTGAEADAESEDPFRDIESLREDSLTGDGGQGGAIASIDTGLAEVEDEDEMELTSFSFDGPQSPLQAPNSHGDGILDGEDDTTDSDNDDDEITEITSLSASLSLAGAHEIAYEPDSSDDDGYQDHTATVTMKSPDAPREAPAPTPIRSALKNTAAISAIPLVNPLDHQTPARSSGHRRSVSFSDGRREGPILGLGRDTDSDASESESKSEAHAGGPSFVPSIRSKRIADMLQGVDDESLSASSDPSQPPANLMVPDATQGPYPLHPGFLGSDAAWQGSMRPEDPVSFKGTIAGTGGQANATFLTEASFGVAHDKLVQVITDIQPFEPYWEELSSVDLSSRNLESVTRLKEFLPRLHTLSLNSNQLAWLSGVPATVRSLSVAWNSLTRASSFSHLLNLENLDISYNNIDGLSQLECLRHLRELRADGNHIKTLDGLQRMDCLVKLSLQKNSIDSADFTQYSWPRLEVLNVSQNRIQRVAGLSLLPSLVVLNLDNNSLDELEAHGILPRLRILRLSANRLKRLDASRFPSLRTLYVDNNSLAEISHANRLNKLENLSLRNQGGKGLSLPICDVRDVKRLYLSGNALPPDFLSEPCYNLVYLEAAACRLSKLPTNLSTLVPNLRVLNLNYNFLDDVKPLEGLRRLNKLTIIGSRLKGTKGLIKVLRGCPDVEMVDFRMNPCTLGWYLPLLVKDVPGALQPSEAAQRASGGKRGQGTAAPSGPDLGQKGGSGATSRGGNRDDPRDGTSGDAPAVSWHELDAKFRRDLPDEAYIGRLTYRGLVMRACSKVRMLDGVAVSRKEREKAEKLLEGVARAKG